MIIVYEKLFDYATKRDISDNTTQLFDAVKDCVENCHGYKRRTYVMNNQALIENILDMWLSQKQLKKSKRLFGMPFIINIEIYKGTVVVDMIKLDLQEV